MASVQFSDVQARPTELLDLTSLTLDEFQQLIPPFDSHSAPPWRRSMDFPRRLFRTHRHTQQCYVVA